jgi:hypothetical protein
MYTKKILPEANLKNLSKHVTNGTFKKILPES